ncbi:rhomboid family intramembrane serine protease [Lacinutrix sp.]|uniref:rhomboid family intramembrane serine protease n=1 Tax=Lacinutrix sp. TaxID=1937692 RepID=UPI0025BBD649|nr:rhomboid family intramembrane serine protease [Lacinutrix sp.]
MKKQEQPFAFNIDTLLYPILFVLLIWLVFAIEIRFGLRFNKYGVYPQTIKGLRGILFSPFIHSGLKHLYSNTIPLFVLSSALFYFYRPVAFKVVIYGVLLSGFITWLIGRPSYHIGASGLIYVLFSFNFFKGLFAKNYRLIALSLVVVFLYGSMFMYAFPIDEQVSWEGHTAGLISGLIFALIFRKSIAVSKRYAWEKPNYNEAEDEFLKHFDENGNFIELTSENEWYSDTSEISQDISKFNYIFKENKE